MLVLHRVELVLVLEGHRLRYDPMVGVRVAVLLLVALQQHLLHILLRGPSSCGETCRHISSPTWTRSRDPPRNLVASPCLCPVLGRGPYPCPSHGLDGYVDSRLYLFHCGGAHRHGPCAGPYPFRAPGHGRDPCRGGTSRETSPFFLCCGSSGGGRRSRRGRGDVFPGLYLSPALASANDGNAEYDASPWNGRESCGTSSVWDDIGNGITYDLDRLSRDLGLSTSIRSSFPLGEDMEEVDVEWNVLDGWGNELLRTRRLGQWFATKATTDSSPAAVRQDT